MTALELRFLGGFSIHQASQPLTSLKSQKGQALLCYLALTGKAHARSVLAGLFWPEMPEDNALMSLRTVLNKLNRHVESYLAVTRQSIAFNQNAAYWLDVNEFEAGVTARSDIGRLQAAVALYQGDFLDGFDLPDAPHFDGWVLAQRAQLRQAALGALHHLISHFAGQGDYETAISYVRQLLSIEPWQEEAHRELMHLLALSGQRSAALVQYETCRRILAEELAVEPASATVSLYEQIKDNRLTPTTTIGLGQASFLRLPSDDNVIVGQRVAAVPLHNLPAQTTPFIGREAELAALAQYLADPTVRLITILGPGGIGKSRLALAAAEAQLNSQQPALFPHGVYFVSLAGLETANSLVPAIAEALNFRFAESDEPKVQLLRYLRQKAMLLVLDNFEHLRAGAALVDEIVQTAPGIKLLVTSREKLNRQAEQLFPIGGMALPQGEATGEEANVALGSYSAIQLFCQRARRVQPDFALTAENQSHVLRICRLVQGMPLGIVLAAAWLEVLTPPEIVAEMSRNRDFLATDMADVPERQRSLRAAFNHSWRLLNQQEQHIFRQLSIFRGGFTREAAEAVTGASLRDLQALANKSLLNRTPGGRYEVHELLRQFGAEKLAQAAEVEAAVRDRHSAHYCAFLYEHTEHWHTARQLETLAAVTCEADNVQVAWQWALAQGEWQRLVQAIDSWSWFHDWQGRDADGEAFCQAIVEQVKKQTAGETAISPDCLRLRAKALAWQGRFTAFTAHGNTILPLFQQSLTLLAHLERAGQAIGQERAFLLYIQGFTLGDRFMDFQVARRSHEQALILYQELGDKCGIARSLAGLGWIDSFTGHYASALDNLRSALAIQQEWGDRRAQSDSISSLGRVHRALGQLEEAERLHREASSLSQQAGDRLGLIVHKATLAMTLLSRGKFEEAHQLAGESLALYQDLGYRLIEDVVRRTLGETLLHIGHYQQARQQAAQSLVVITEMRLSRDPRLYCLLGDLALVTSSYVEAQAAYTESVKISRENGENYFVGLALAGLGYTAYRLGQWLQLRQYLAEALTTLLAVKAYLPAVYALPGIALLLAAAGNMARALEILALAKIHPFVAHSKWFEDVAGRELEALVATLPSEVAEAARERGQRLELWPTTEALLAELEPTKMAER